MITFKTRESGSRREAGGRKPGWATPIAPGFTFIKNTNFPVNFLSGFEGLACPLAKVAIGVGFRLVIEEVALSDSEILGTAGGENVAAELALGAALGLEGPAQAWRVAYPDGICLVINF